MKNIIFIFVTSNIFLIFHDVAILIDTKNVKRTDFVFQTYKKHQYATYNRKIFFLCPMQRDVKKKNSDLQRIYITLQINRNKEDDFFPFNLLYC